MPDQIITVDPSTGLQLAVYEAMETAAVERQVRDAAVVQRAWADVGLARRCATLGGVAAALRGRKAELASLAVSEMGKPIREAEAEIEKCAWVCEHYAIHGVDALAAEQISARSWISYEPLGTVLGVMPWNYPYWQVFRFLVPTLAAGNAGLLKHAANVSGCAVAIQGLLEESGLPTGVFRTLLIADSRVPDTISGLVADDRIAAVSFTGSNRVGASIGALAGRAAKKCVLELGGSDPFVVLADADLDVVVPNAVRGRFLNAGQSCVSSKRFIVHASIVEEFGRRLAQAVTNLAIGDPALPGTEVGPMARPDLCVALHEQVVSSIDAGAVALVGAEFLDRGPCWYAPTVLVNVTNGMPVMREEVFGPVAPVISFEDDDDAVRLANSTNFGLGASVWSGDDSQALSVGHRIQSGGLFINAIVASDPRLPFGGVKQSGHGRELGVAGAREFTNVRTIVVG